MQLCKVYEALIYSLGMPGSIVAFQYVRWVFLPAWKIQFRSQNNHITNLSSGNHTAKIFHEDPPQFFQMLHANFAQNLLKKFSWKKHIYIYIYIESLSWSLLGTTFWWRRIDPEYSRRRRVLEAIIIFSYLFVVCILAVLGSEDVDRFLCPSPCSMIWGLESVFHILFWALKQIHHVYLCQLPNMYFILCLKPLAELASRQ